jgi:riboflavin-specific deaminase-like protein
MRRLLPPPTEDVDAVSSYRHDERVAPPERPWVLLNMVASIDGAIALDGRSGGLSNADDKAIFQALRALADVVLVGAGTVRAENYGPVRLADDEVARRQAEGRPPQPLLAVVSGRLALDPGARLFSDPTARPLLLTGSHTGPGQRRAFAEIAEIAQVGHTRVDPRLALRELHERGARVVVCEGGPTLNGELLAAGLVDEVCLTVAPLLVGGASPRVTAGPSRPEPAGMALNRVLESGGWLFLRYVRR